MRTTRTYAILEVSGQAYEEIRAALEDAGYQHAFHDDVIDMHGIALQAGGSDEHMARRERVRVQES